jgi:hypothetical protein
MYVSRFPITHQFNFSLSYDKYYDVKSEESFLPHSVVCISFVT